MTKGEQIELSKNKLIEEIDRLKLEQLKVPDLQHWGRLGQEIRRLEKKLDDLYESTKEKRKNFVQMNYSFKR